MMVDYWPQIKDPRPILNLDLVTDVRKLRLFCVACCRRVMNHFHDERSREAVEVSEAYADGLTGLESLRMANEEAYSARSTRSGNFHTLDAGWYCSQSPANAFWCANACAAGAELGRTSQAGTPHNVTGEWPELVSQAELLRDIFCNPHRPVAFDAAWRTSTAVALARGMYASRDFGAMPILADALQDAGCDSDAVLTHCRDPQQVHVRGCWVVDLVLGKG